MFAAGAFGNTVSLDPSFNGTGYRLHTVRPQGSIGYSLAIQPDGKILVAGRTRHTLQDRPIRRDPAECGRDARYFVRQRRYGFLASSMRAVASEPNVMIQPDGKILLGATAYLTQPQTFAFAVFRFTSDGVPDTTFNSTGYATANAPNSFWDMCLAMDLGADGKIVLVGQALTTPGQSPDWDIAVVRFNADGSPDTTFDGDGVIKIGTPAADEEAHSVLVQADGKIIVGGRETTDREKFLLTRFNANGSTDTSYGTSGWNIFQIDFVNNNFTSLARQSDGRMLAGGGGKILRFTADGVRDMAFGRNGVQSETGTIEQVEIRVIGGDKFLVATRYGARRFMPNGAVDTNYGTGFNVSGNFCYMRSVAVQSDGKAVLAGYCNGDTDDINRFAVARFQEKRTLRHLDFTGDEQTDISIFRPSNGQWWYQESWTCFIRPSPRSSAWRPTDRFRRLHRRRQNRHRFFPSFDGRMVYPAQRRWFVSLVPVRRVGRYSAPGDFDGDGKADPTFFVLRPTNGLS